MSAAAPPVRHWHRDSDAGLIAGVCAGLGRRLNVEPGVIRVAFLIGAITGLGLAVYAALWVLLPDADRPATPLATRLRGRRGAWRVSAGVGCLVLSALLTLRELGWWVGDAVAWPAVLAGSGLALVWRMSRRQAKPSPERATPRAPLAEPQPAMTAGELRTSVYSGGFGVALIIGAGLLLLNSLGVLQVASDAVLQIVVVIAAIALILAPFWVRFVRDFTDERAARIRSQERAEVAAHLHDSVLQTLALVQKRADDPRAVATLARRQERELRAWLNGAGAARPDDRMADALTRAAAEVEEEHVVVIDVVAVGDRALDDHGRALVAAAREAMVNAAKFAGADGPVSVYAEMDERRAQVFVRDRGPGFDPAAVPEDRRGVRESISGRMQRHGGAATIVSAPGAGTEVELTLEEPA